MTYEAMFTTMCCTSTWVREAGAGDKHWGHILRHAGAEGVVRHVERTVAMKRLPGAHTPMAQNPEKDLDFLGGEGVQVELRQQRR
jgi:hypothetical protein